MNGRRPLVAIEQHRRLLRATLRAAALGRAGFSGAEKPFKSPLTVPTATLNAFAMRCIVHSRSPYK
jgi:hypothetical protein